MYSGGMVKERGVSIVLHCEIAKRAVQVEQYSDSVLMVKLQAEPVDIVLVQVYICRHRIIMMWRLKRCMSS